MKVLKLLGLLLGFILIAQSFLTACPTCLNTYTFGEKKEIIGEMGEMKYNENTYDEDEE